MFQALRFCNPKYTASLNKVLEMLEQMESAEQTAKEAFEEEAADE